MVTFSENISEFIITVVQPDYIYNRQCEVEEIVIYTRYQSSSFQSDIDLAA